MATDAELKHLASVLQELQDAKTLADHAAQALYVVDKSYYDENRRNLDFAIHDGRKILLKHADYQALDMLLKKLKSMSSAGEESKSIEKLLLQCRSCNDALKRVFEYKGDVQLRIDDIDPAAGVCRKTASLIAKAIRDIFRSWGEGRVGQGTYWELVTCTGIFSLW